MSTNEAPLSVVIAAGGTGGHIYPGIALAEALVAARPDADVTFLGTPRGLESRLIPAAGFPLDTVDMVPFSGSDRLRAPFALIRSTLQARRILRRRRATVVVGMGGYPSLPAISAAAALRLPRLIHESGATLGRANLLAARLVPNIALAFPHLEGALPAKAHVRVVGMPLRHEVSQADFSGLRATARERWGLAGTMRFVLMFGGSQGAATLNRLAIDLSMRWRERDDITIMIKTGPKHQDEVRDALKDVGTSTIVTDFIDRMDLAYAAADLVVCRAGAGTVAEVAIAGLPAIFVPYPHAPGDHQTMNAAELVQAGAAMVVADDEASGAKVGPMIESIFEEEGRLEAMASAALEAARPRAAEDLASWVLEVAG